VSTFRSLRNRNYRLFAAGPDRVAVRHVGQRVAQDWLVLELSGNSGIALGITTGLQFLPVLVLGLYGGVLADRYDKRRLLIGAQAAMGVLALVLAVLDLSGAVQLWHVYALALALGLASVVDTPVRQAFVSEMVDADDLPNAVSLNSATFNSARIVGPAAAGRAIARSDGWVFLVNAVSYVAVIAGLAAMRRADLHPAAPLERAKGQLREGLAYVRSRPDLLVPIVLVFMVGTFGLNFQITLALVVKEVFERSAGAYGLLSAFLALGSLVGALASARRSGPPRQRTLFASVLAFGLLEMAVGLAPTYELMALLLVPTGVAVLTFTTTANSTVQLGSAPARARARHGAVRPRLHGRHPDRCAAHRALAEAFGPRSSIVLGGRGRRRLRRRRGGRHDAGARPAPRAAPRAPAAARARPAAPAGGRAAVRTFVAVRPPPAAVDHLRSSLPAWPSAPERWHLTLAFLGEVPDPAALAPELAAVCAGHRPLDLRLAGSGTFGRGGPVWVGVEGDRVGLSALAGDVAQACRHAGVDVERRPYRPTSPSAAAAGPDPAAPAAYAGPSWTGDRGELVASRLGPVPSSTGAGAPAPVGLTGAACPAAPAGGAGRVSAPPGLRQARARQGCPGPTSRRRADGEHRAERDGRSTRRGTTSVTSSRTAPRVRQSRPSPVTAMRFPSRTRWGLRPLANSSRWNATGPMSVTVVAADSSRAVT
jgi:2'-5' RNA ligase/MFS family permease